MLGGNGNIITTHHRNSITSNYGSIGVIDSRNPTDLKTFVESTYDKYERLDEHQMFRNVLRTIVRTKLDGSFAELRALQIASAIDVLVGGWSRLHNRTSIFVPTVFKKGVDGLKKVVQEYVISSLDATDEQIDELRLKIQELNRRSFRANLREMIKEFGPSISEDEIGDFVKSRNSLVHAGHFATDIPSTELFKMFHFADRLVLAVLGYRGAFLDCQSWQTVQATANDGNL